MLDSNAVIYYIPVKEEFIGRWEYYSVDKDVLSELFSTVYVCNSLACVLKNIFKVKYIYGWWWSRSSIIVLLSKMFNIKSVITGAIHMFDISGAEDFYKKNIFYRWSSMLSLSLADANLFISKDQYYQIVSHLYVNNPILLRSSLSKSCDVSSYELLKLKYNNDFTSFLTIVWHTLDQYKRKGIYESLDAISLLKNRTSFKFKWYIVGGNGDGLSHLKNKILALDLSDEVVVMEDVSQDKKKELYLNCDLYIQPSWCEGFGNAVLEAMSHGLPVLVSRYTAQPEVVGQSGLIAMDVSSEEIYKQLSYFMLLDINEKKSLSNKVLDTVNNNYLFSHRYNQMKLLFQDL